MIQVYLFANKPLNTNSSLTNIIRIFNIPIYRLPNYYQLKNQVKNGRIMSAKTKNSMSLNGDSEMIKKEMQNLEKIKQKQEKDMEQKMLYEQQLADIQNRNEDKMRLEGKREQKRKKELQRKQKDQERKVKQAEERKRLEAEHTEQEQQQMQMRRTLSVILEKF
jgi:hypothetical protein